MKVDKLMSSSWTISFVKKFRNTFLISERSLLSLLVQGGKCNAKSYGRVLFFLFLQRFPSALASHITYMSCSNIITINP